MHQKIIMVVAAGLQDLEGRVRADLETNAVCIRAANLTAEYPEAIVYATAGWSADYGVWMGEGPMREALLRHSAKSERIRTPRADTFNTDGEMRTLVKDISWEEVTDLEIFVVCRSWHLPRAWRLLLANLSPEQREKTRIVRVPVKSLERPRDKCREWLAWVVNAPKLLRAF